MDILYQISYLLSQAMDDRQKTDPEYRSLHHLEDTILGKIEALAGKDLVDKLTDAQEERMESDRLVSFLYGLRLGVELLRL